MCGVNTGLSFYLTVPPAWSLAEKLVDGEESVFSFSLRRQAFGCGYNAKTGGERREETLDGSLSMRLGT